VRAWPGWPRTQKSRSLDHSLRRPTRSHQSGLAGRNVR
jgi:hypothetical protein